MFCFRSQNHLYLTYLEWIERHRLTAWILLSKFEVHCSSVCVYILYIAQLNLHVLMLIFSAAYLKHVQRMSLNIWNFKNWFNKFSHLCINCKKKKKYHDWEAIHKEIQNEDFQRWCTCYKLLVSQRRIKKHKSIDIKDVTFLQPIIINIKFLKII